MAKEMKPLCGVTIDAERILPSYCRGGTMYCVLVEGGEGNELHAHLYGNNGEYRLVFEGMARFYL